LRRQWERPRSSKPIHIKPRIENTLCSVSTPLCRSLVCRSGPDPTMPQGGARARHGGVRREYPRFDESMTARLTARLIA
jgi:hypothetical protein